MGSIKYVVKSRKNPINKQVKYYAASATHEMVSEAELVHQITQKTTVSRADILAVLAALQEEIRFNLMNGRKVKLNDIGTFRTSISGLGSMTAAEVNATNINNCRVIFTPARAISSDVRPKAGKVSFVNVEQKPAAAVPGVGE